MSLEEKQAAALRQRRRAFLDEVATIKKRQGGITKSQEQILEDISADHALKTARLDCALIAP